MRVEYNVRRAMVLALACGSMAFALPRQSFDIELLSALYEAPENVAGANSAADDYAPTNDAMYRRVLFASDRTGESKTYSIPIDSLFAINMKTVPLVAGTMNEDGTSRAHITVGNDGTIVGTWWKMHRHRAYAGLVSVERRGEELNAGVAIDAVNGPFFVSHPTISPDGSRLVFVSDRSGNGRLNLYMSQRLAGGSWQEPVGLGPALTSGGDEITPWFMSVDTLVFASNGMGGKGGFDVFISVFRDGAWQEPEPVDFCNSPFDDSDFLRLPDGTILFASNRPGGRGGLDLYVARLRRPEIR
jgi:hypothetical protein